MDRLSAIPAPLLDVQSAALAQSAKNARRPNRTETQARAAAESFESVFLFEVMQSMYADIKPGAFGGGNDENLYRSMMNEEVAKSISRQGGIGIADSPVALFWLVREIAPTWVLVAVLLLALMLVMSSLDHARARNYELAPESLGRTHAPWHVTSSMTTLHKIFHDEDHPSYLLLPVIPS